MILECGLSFYQPNVASSNLRVVGGSKAVENSWPSQVYISFKYKGIFYLSDEFVEVTILDSCSGTLIDSKTVLTAAHCIRKNSFNYVFKNKDYNLMFKSNKNYPTLESMYTVYLGVNDISFLNSSYLVTRSISSIIRVSMN